MTDTLDRQGVRASVRAALEAAQIPDLDKVMQQLENGLEAESVLDYTIALTGRADDFLTKLINSIESIPPDDRPASVDKSVQTLLDEMYPEQGTS